MVFSSVRTWSTSILLPLLIVFAIQLIPTPANAVITDTAVYDYSGRAHSTSSPILFNTASDLALESAYFAHKFQMLPLNDLTGDVIKKYTASIINIPNPEVIERQKEEASLVALNPNAFKGFSFLKLEVPLNKPMISSPFGWRWGRPHQGTDFAAPMRTPVHAAESGQVEFAGWKGGYGQFIVIDHGKGIKTHYAHLSGIGVKAGQSVNRGDLIGRVGNTGYSTGPHLHFEVVANGTHLNPEQYLHTKQAPTHTALTFPLYFGTPHLMNH